MSPAPRISRRRLLAAGAAGVAALAGPVSLPGLAAAARAADAPESGNVPAAAGGYRWRNAEIVGGGFVPGIVFNRAERGLVYARTDIGGAYRLDAATGRWEPLLDWVGWDEWGHTGVISLATDERDPDRVYAAVGTYTNPDWDPSLGAVLRSTDRGRTWQTSPLPFRLGGNMPGRGIGERLAVDPHRNSVLYLGARGGHGLWRSTDHGRSWAQVTSFPNAGTFVPDPSDTSGYNSDNLGVLQPLFDRRGGSSGRATRTLYVTVADPQNILYRSHDAGATWERVPGQPTGYIPHKAVLDDENGFLYLATSNTAGPYDGSKGDVWKLDTATDTWTCVSPVPSTSGDDGFGYSGLSIDRQNPSTLMVATQISWWPDIVIYRSTDGGSSWTRAWDWGAYPQRSLRYDMDVSAAPWLTFNQTPALPELSPKLGWMTEALEIDPFDSDHFLYGTGATIYGSDNLTDWDRSGGTVHLSVRAQGLEETAVLSLVSPPTGEAHLLSAVGDIGGFRHLDLTSPVTAYDTPTFGTTIALDFAELAPETVVRVGSPSGSWTQHFAISLDGGVSWQPSGTEPTGTTGPGTDESAVAVGADGRRVLWAPGGAAVSRTEDGGRTWTAVSGLPAGASLRADRVDPDLFYACSGGVFYRSTDGGRSFAATGATGLPATGNVRFKAVPGRRGDVWFAGGKAGATYGLWRSTDAGSTFTRLPGVDEGDVVGFGMAAPGASYPAVFTSAKIRGVRGLFRSDDAGRHWERINDDRHQYGWTGATITGDPRIHGRVYVGTNGRGIIVGDLH